MSFALLIGLYVQLVLVKAIWLMRSGTVSYVFQLLLKSSKCTVDKKWYISIITIVLYIKSIIVTDKLRSQKCTVISHPPYSPDFGPMYFYLFGKKRRAFHNIGFSSCDEIIAKIKNFCTCICTDEYKSVHEEWLRCAHKLSESHRSYCL